MQPAEAHELESPSRGQRLDLVPAEAEVDVTHRLHEVASIMGHHVDDDQPSPGSEYPPDLADDAMWVPHKDA